MENEFLNEDKEILMEMSTLRKKDTNLPVNIWVDDIAAERNTPHNRPKIKFQNNTSDRVLTREAIPMSIDDNPEILVKNFKTKLSNEQVNAVRKFIVLNKDVLSDYWNNKITLFQFIARIKPIE